MKYSKRKNTKRGALIVLAAILIAGGAALLWTFVLSPFDAQAQAGTVTSPGEIAARLQKEADDSTFRIKVNKEMCIRDSVPPCEGGRPTGRIHGGGDQGI